jgi:VWFA-related protein
MKTLRQLTMSLGLICIVMTFIIMAQDLTWIAVTVVDPGGRVVSTLSAQDFVIVEDGVPQTIAQFTFDRVSPITYGLLIDRSASVACSLKTMLQVADAFVQSLGPNDEAFITTFAGEFKILEDFTIDRTRLRAALKRPEFQSVGQSTNLYLAMQSAFERMRRGKHRKRALVVFSDGHDAQAFASSPEWVKTVARNAEVPLFGIAVVGTPQKNDAVPIVMDRRNTDAGPVDVRRTINQPPPPVREPVRPSCRSELTINPNFATIAAETTGRVFTVPIHASGSELDGRTQATAGDISTTVRGQYVIGYNSRAPKDKLRTLRVRTTNSTYTVRTRRNVLDAGRE